MVQQSPRRPWAVGVPADHLPSRCVHRPALGAAKPWTRSPHAKSAPAPTPTQREARVHRGPARRSDRFTRARTRTAHAHAHAPPSLITPVPPQFDNLPETATIIHHRYDTMSISLRLAIPAAAPCPVLPPRTARPAGNAAFSPAALRGCAALPLRPRPLGAVRPCRSRGSGIVCSASAYLSPPTTQWVSVAAAAVLLLAKGTAYTNLSSCHCLFYKHLPRNLVDQERNMGCGLLFLRYKSALFLPFPGELELPLSTMLAVSCSLPGELELPLSTMLLISIAPYQLMNLSMSEKPSDDTTGQVRPEGDVSDVKVETANQNKGNEMPSAQQEEAVIKKKYGGVLPKKSPLISKDHERAYFDSADWALGKQGGHPQKPKGPLKHFIEITAYPAASPFTPIPSCIYRQRRGCQLAHGGYDPEPGVHRGGQGRREQGIQRVAPMSFFERNSAICYAHAASLL
ncbi:hypothetical protein ZWY2020_045251 [Hordeum vulgare]|nr:hypothetical protein ZWY2020_045251 [Hordeum vulgare]